MKVIDHVHYNSMNILDLKTNYMVVGRAATGIYLILKANKIHNEKILVPANICYAAVYPIIYSGNIPVFCDVNVKTGNIETDILIKYADTISGAIVPHMYGNPVVNMDTISNICHKHHILLIEDCASAMGAEYNNKVCGCWGDYSIFSTGYSKTIDIGYGGLVLSDRSLENLYEIYNNLEKKRKYHSQDEQFFSRLYRLIRNSENHSMSNLIWHALLNDLEYLFVYRDDIDTKKLLEALDKLDNIVGQRRFESEIYHNHINSCDMFMEYEFADGAVPWRYSMLVDPLYKKEIVQNLLKRNIPVSDWYPVVTPVFGDSDSFPNALDMERRILNFPLCIGENTIIDICQVINTVLKEVAE